MTQQPVAPPAPNFADFRNRHAGGVILVCGCGESLNELAEPERFVTIGVNDVGRRFDPDYLVVVNPRAQFSGDRYHYVENSGARYLFSQLDPGPVRPAVVRFRLGRRGGVDFSDPEVLHYTQNSPYVALCLAIHMGARHIGLIGVDFTEHHFFARTGRHALAGRLEQINREYAALAAACRALGVNIVNLSRNSRLTAFPKGSLEDWAAKPAQAPAVRAVSRRMRVFAVNYRFLTCGDVFTTALRHAAGELPIDYAEAYWDDPRLPEKVAAVDPDLLFVVHGRRFAQRWGDAFRGRRSAVWLVDEPYEVDDTAAWSGRFDTVFVNDPSTLAHHRNAHYLPMAYDPRTALAGEGGRPYAVGFIGGYNRTRERSLLRLLDAGLLSYVVGNGWKSERLRRLCLAGHTEPARTAELYAQTRLVVNVFRDVHHFNREKVQPWSLNPRVYEALACGALVVSEWRPEAPSVFPQLPTFATDDELVALVRDLSADENRYRSVLDACRQRLPAHTYARRLAGALAVALGAAMPTAATGPAPQTPAPPEPAKTLPQRRPAPASATRAPQRPVLAGAVPFGRVPVRNLLYHLWPVKGTMWRFNLEELQRRVDLFNGRRIITIVHDARAEDPEEVMACLEGQGCEFIVTDNDASGESRTFPQMLERVRSDDPDEITFYAHGKGVKYEPSVPPPVRRWTEVLYHTALDDWLRVSRQLQAFALAGPFKRLGRYKTHQELGDWHYCGTFFWFRHASVFARGELDVPAFYGGVEAWPGIHFRPEEAGSLFLDTPLDRRSRIPYEERFWRAVGDPALKAWHARVEKVPVPADLAQPIPFGGHASPRTEQKPEELDWWIRLLLEADVRRLLTIGPAWGGVEWHVARIFREQGRDIEITAIDPQPRPELRQTLAEAERNFAQKLRLVEGQPDAEATRRQLAAAYDAVHIDGDHGYRAARRDWELARSVGARHIAFHDIVDSHWHAQNRCCVSRLWAELKAGHRTLERSGSDWGGIGVVCPD